MAKEIIPLEYFHKLVNQACKSDEIEPGKMMHEPGIKKNGKVIAFFNRKENAMVFRLGKEPLIENHTKKLKPFNPFKNKGPLTGWYSFDESESALWDRLLEMALAKN